MFATIKLVFYVSIIFIYIISTTAVASTLKEDFSELETSYAGRIGIFAINTSNNQLIKYRAYERFPFCSTSKFMVVAAILKKSMLELDLLNKIIFYQPNDLVDYSPVTEKYISQGMSISELAQAAITLSDNTAMNLLIGELGGVFRVTQFARSIGDLQFRLDRTEPELNTSLPGDERDTTTPFAMGKSLKRLVLGDILGSSQRNQLLLWLKNNTTGNARIRAGVPKNWIVGDKTGGGSYYGTTNDIGIIFPPTCKPIVLAIYFTQNIADAPRRDEIVAIATRFVIREFGKNDLCLQREMYTSSPEKNQENNADNDRGIFTVTKSSILN